jgi:dTDP-4-dehydrorhamnose reductase
MNILVIGRGWTGKKVVIELRNRGHIVTVCSHKIAFEVLTQDKYDWVVNCAGVTGVPNVDACESNKKETLEGNAVFPILLYHECQKVGTRLAHFSSGCIYSGEITDVNADPNFFGSIYSISKGVSDSYLKDKAQVFRIRMPFTHIDEPKNYISKVLKYARTGKLIDYGQNSLTDLDEAVRVACDLIEENAPNGPYNLVNKGSVNMHEFAEIFNITPQWFTADEFTKVTVAARSTCTIPPYEKMSDVRDALKRVTQTLDNSNTTV